MSINNISMHDNNNNEHKMKNELSLMWVHITV